MNKEMKREKILMEIQKLDFKLNGYIHAAMEQEEFAEQYPKNAGWHRQEADRKWRIADLLHKQIAFLRLGL